MPTFANPTLAEKGQSASQERTGQAMTSQFACVHEDSEETLFESVREANVTMTEIVAVLELATTLSVLIPATTHVASRPSAKLSTTAPFAPVQPDTSAIPSVPADPRETLPAVVAQEEALSWDSPDTRGSSITSTTEEMLTLTNNHY